MIFNMTGGGAALNFKVVGNPQPDSPNENTIWANTDVEITGWHFYATQPEELAEGEIWFSSIHNSGVSFNALKKNALEVFAREAKQMVSGELVTVKFELYKNGEWVTPERILFAPGKVNELFKNIGQENSSYTFKEDRITMNSAGQYFCGFGVAYAEPIALSGFKLMQATIKGNVSNNAEVKLLVFSDLPSFGGTCIAAAKALSKNGEQTITLTIDGDVYKNGEFYVGVTGIFCSIDLLDWRLA